jgi:hypothetical protein
MNKEDGVDIFLGGSWRIEIIKAIGPLMKIRCSIALKMIFLIKAIGH